MQGTKTSLETSSLPLWEPNLRSGDPDLDDRHAELFGLIDLLLAAAESNDLASARPLLARLRVETLDHFADEQGRLAERRDPLLRVHCEAHQAFLTDLDGLAAELTQRGLSPLFKLWASTRLVDWLRYHTRTLDRALVEDSRSTPGPSGAGGWAGSTAPA